MKKIAIIYSFNTVKTAQTVKEIKHLLGFEIDELNAETITGSQFLAYNFLILGVPTWFDGELPNYWDEFVPELQTLNLTGKKFALFGNGDQIGYPENFVDGLGIMANILEKQGATIVGYTNTEGYTYESSRAVKDNKFVGLALDFENQSNLNTKRIKAWIDSFKNEI